jgi:hypothetical protein
MGQKFLRPWAGIVFLVPFLVAGDLTKKGPGEVAPETHGDGQKENEVAPPPEEPLPRWLSTITEDIACELGVSPDLVKSIIWAESKGDPRKLSPKGAKGLMQLMPLVAQYYKVSDPYDPVANIRAGVQYFCNLLEEFSGDIPLALAAYNAGPTAVRKYRGIPPFRETQAFVKKVSDLFQAAESMPPFPLLAPLIGEREIAAMVENPPARMTIRGSPKILAFLLKNIPADAQEVQTQ